MEEGKRYTKEDVLQITINIMQQLSFPVMLSEAYAVPIQKCVENLNLVMEMIRMEKEALEKKTNGGANDGGKSDSE